MAVAAAAWLADLAWPAVVGVMALALAIAWLVEWVSWRDAQARAAAPWPDHPQVVEVALPDPVPETPPVVETLPDPVAPEADPEPVRVPPEVVSVPEPLPPEPIEAGPDPVAVEADPDPEPEPVSVSPEVVSLPEPPPEPLPPERVEAGPEREPDERRSESQAEEAPELQAPAASTRRGWRGMGFRWVDREATSPPEEPALAEDPIEVPEPTPAPASEPPVQVESRPEPEPRPLYPPPRSVPRPAPDQPAPVVPRVAANVVRMPRSAQAREWNVWELESLAREQARLEPERGEEWSYLFVHLRQFADAEGTLPSEFDGLVRESFGELLETLERA